MFGDDGRGKKPPEAVSKKLMAAIDEVKPRRLVMNVTQIAALDVGLADVETLFLSDGVSAGKSLPDLSKLRGLRHLML